MATAVTIQNERRKHLCRRLLRVFTGAALGAPFGGILGFLLGAISAVLVSVIQGTFNLHEQFWPSITIPASFGIIPGVPGGFLIGSTIIVGDDRKRLRLATTLGMLTGVAYAVLWYSSFRHQPLILASMVMSGLLGGVSMTALLQLLRRRKQWWTRWEGTETR